MSSIISGSVDLYDTEITFRDTSTLGLLARKLLLQTFLPLLTRPVAETFARLILAIPVGGEFVVRHVGPFPLFCGGVTIADSSQTVSKLDRAGIRTILDFSAEGLGNESDFDHTRDEVLRVIAFGRSMPNVPFAVFKMTGVGRKALLEKVSAGKPLSDAERTEFDRVVQRAWRLCEAASGAGKRILIDAEETWIQPAIDDVAERMMKEFNREQAIVFNTVQMYRRDRLDYLARLMAAGVRHNYIPGVKLVRGAYMENERERAAQLGYTSPIHATKEDTDNAFNTALGICVNNISQLALVVGTHNPESVQTLLSLMAQRGLEPSDRRIECSQLLGMGDNLSRVLASRGYNASKYVPYGPLRGAIPYLLRRARENSSVGNQARRELQLIDKELARRWTRFVSSRTG